VVKKVVIVMYQRLHPGRLQPLHEKRAQSIPKGRAVNTEEGAVNTKGGAVNTEEGAVNTVCLGATAAVDNPISSDEGGDATIVTTTDVVVPELVFAIAYFRRDFRR
jgi:hypothetical protein